MVPRDFEPILASRLGFETGLTRFAWTSSTTGAGNARLADWSCYCVGRGGHHCDGVSGHRSSDGVVPAIRSRRRTDESLESRSIGGSEHGSAGGCRHRQPVENRPALVWGRSGGALLGWPPGAAQHSGIIGAHAVERGGGNGHRVRHAGAAGLPPGQRVGHQRLCRGHYSAKRGHRRDPRGDRNALRAIELQGVIGHEFSHILNGDMRLNLRLIGVLNGILLIAMIGLFSDADGIEPSVLFQLVERWRQKRRQSVAFIGALPVCHRLHRRFFWAPD